MVLWSSQEWHFAEIDDAFATGSSIILQKKNPDIAELVRGKTGRVYGHLVNILTVMKGLLRVRIIVIHCVIKVLSIPRDPLWLQSKYRYRIDDSLRCDIIFV